MRRRDSHHDAGRRCSEATRGAAAAGGMPVNFPGNNVRRLRFGGVVGRELHSGSLMGYMRSAKAVPDIPDYPNPDRDFSAGHCCD